MTMTEGYYEVIDPTPRSPVETSGWGDSMLLAEGRGELSCLPERGEHNLRERRGVRAAGREEGIRL